MSYHLRKRYGHGRRSLQGLGDVTSTLTAVADVANDPYLSEVVCRVGQLKAIKNGLVPNDCADTAPGLTGGVGLDNAVVPLRMYVYAQQNKWVYPVAAVLILGIPFMLGYELGKD